MSHVVSDDGGSSHLGTGTGSRGNRDEVGNGFGDMTVASDGIIIIEQIERMVDLDRKSVV